MKWANRWPVRRDIRHLPKIDLADLARRTSSLVPHAALIITPEQLKLFTVVDLPEIETASAVIFTPPEKDLVGAEAEVDAAIVALKGESDGGKGSVAVKGEVDRMSLAIADLKLAQTSKAKTEIVFEVQQKPADCAGWWSNAPVFIVEADEKIEE